MMNISSGRTNGLRRTNRLMCKREEQIFRRTNRLIFGCLERRFFPDDLPVETNKSTTIRHKFTSKEHMPDNLSVQTICSSSSVKTANLSSPVAVANGVPQGYGVPSGPKLPFAIQHSTFYHSTAIQKLTKERRLANPTSLT